jgi:IclR family transcriptional regulator, acetate operon repressor
VSGAALEWSQIDVPPAMPPGSAARKTLVQSVSRAVAVLGVLRDAPGPMSALAVAQVSGLDRTVVHRLLKTLTSNGFAIEADGSYRVGPAVVLLANRYIADRSIRRVAVPYLVDLQTHAIGDRPWTVTMSIPVDGVTTVIERIWTKTTPLGLVLDIGDTFPVDRTAVGRSLLAYHPAAQVTELIGERRHAELAGVLEEIRSSGGVGLAQGVAGAAVEAVAAVIRSRRGEPLAGVAVTGVSLGDQLDYDSPLARSLRRAADSIGQLV